MSLLIRDATVITVDPAQRIFDLGAVYVEGERIGDVGSSAEVLSRHPDATRMMDGRRKSSPPGSSVAKYGSIMAA